MNTRRRFGQASDATPRELPTHLVPDSDEAGQMVAVSRQCRQSHMNARSYTRMHKHTQTHARGKTEPAKYQCTAAGPRRAAESNRERRHTHTHQTRAQTYTHSATLTAALYYTQTL